MMMSLILILRSGSSALMPLRISAARSISISVVRKKCGTGPSDVTRRLAIVFEFHWPARLDKLMRAGWNRPGSTGADNSAQARLSAD
jgi:hypothetical protein